MKADLSRGHQPDQKRGQRYRRVLLQQGRLLLDSDLAAMSDAIDAQLRDVAVDAFGAAGSPDLGFLITPGRLLASFESLDHVTSPTTDAQFRYNLDHGKRYLRLPSLYLGGLLRPGKVSIALRSEVVKGITLHLWARIPYGTSLRVTIGSQETTVHGKDANAFLAYEVESADGGSTLTIAFANTVEGPDAGREAWIGLIEVFEPAEKYPTFWVRQGSYLLGGLNFSLTEDMTFPEVSFLWSTGLGSTQYPKVTGSGPQLFMAYLEGWERVVTHVEDGGILEQALGGAIDTCVRTRGVGQVKLARCTELTEKDTGAILRAFDTVKSPTGKLTITQAFGSSTLDPCAIPEAEGYTGGDNRLYRFEVHHWTSTDSFAIKWSRNNGADLFRAEFMISGGSVDRVQLAPGADLRDGDLVELLDETVELGDHVPASLDKSGFTPAKRAVGNLYHVREVPDAPGQIRLLNLDNGTPAVFKYSAGEKHAPKLRRWHGLLQKGLDHTVDGLEVKLDVPAGLDAPFHPGDYWQYEARRLYGNENGDWQASPHGPERLFAPLALLAFEGEDSPLRVVAWLGKRFSPLGELEAGDVAYDGVKSGSTADNVQAAIDELFARHDDGCCQVDLEPEENPTDDAARINKLLSSDKLKKGGVIFLRPGVYWLRSQITIDRPIELRGCPDAVLVADAADVHGTPVTPIVIKTGKSLVLSKIVLCTNGASRHGPALVEVMDASLSVEECGLFHLGPAKSSGLPGNPGTAITTLTSGDEEPSIFPIGGPTFQYEYTGDYGTFRSTGPKIQVVDSVVVSRWGIAAGYLDSLELRGSVFRCRDGAVHISEQLKHIDISDCALSTGLDNVQFQLLAGLDTAAVEMGTRKLLETELTSHFPNGTVFYAHDLYGGSVTRSTFYGHLCFCAQYAYRLSLQGNTYTCRNGIRLDNVVESQLVGENIKAMTLAPGEHPIGIMVVRSALKLSISECIVYEHSSNGDKYGAGILLGTRSPRHMDPKLNETQSRRFRDVSIRSSSITAKGTCIQIRDESDAEGAAGLPDLISISDNNIQVTGESAISYGCSHTWPEVEPGHVLITGNRIEVPPVSSSSGPERQGVHVQGGCVSVLDNHISVHSKAVIAYAIHMNDTHNSVIQENIVVIIGVGEEEESDAMAQGVWLRDCRSARIIGNSFRTIGTTRSLETVASVTPENYEMVVKDNDFGAPTYTSKLVLSNGIVCGNKGPMNIHFAGGHGVVSDNVAGNNQYQYHSLIVTSAPASSAVYKIAGNFYPDGAIQTNLNKPKIMYVVGNVANLIIVGSTKDPVNESSRAIVTGNIATSSIEVAPHTKLLMATNMAPAIHLDSPVTGSTSASLLNDNLRA